MSDADLSAIAELVQGPSGATVSVLHGWIEATGQAGGFSTTPDIDTAIGRLPEFATIDVTTEDSDELAAQVRLIGDGPRVQVVSVFFVDHDRDADEAVTTLLSIAPKDYWKRKVVFELLRDAGTPRPAAAPKKAPKPAKRRGSQQYVHVTVEHLERVADTYRNAWIRGENPTQAVARSFDTSRSTASRWVVLARQKKVLGEADGNKAGERISTPRATT